MQPSSSNDVGEQLEQALEQLAQAEETATRLRLELNAAHRRIADLEDFDYGGNSDPLLARIGALKSRVGRTRLGSAAAPLYRRLSRR